MRLKAEVDLEKARKRNRELCKIINRLGMIYSEEWGQSDTVYGEEINHLVMKKRLKKFDYSNL